MTATERAEASAARGWEQADSLHIAVKEQRERAQRAEIERGNAERDAAGWKSQLLMYARAWRRELGGTLLNKVHEIDALVLTTQLRMKELAEAKARIVELEKEVELLKAQKREAGLVVSVAGL